MLLQSVTVFFVTYCTEVFLQMRYDSPYRVVCQVVTVSTSNVARILAALRLQVPYEFSWSSID